ncbi:transcriptional regulator, DeoR family [Candidatus Koribacter versatilis Ellin345]|uniref:Transcriptional regulator, DeoR family n=1 Tax=Koribacter versatilis (strain Ellin345) TaxID=204669 RepID=Q1IHV4_KORVE|nr:YafY family protein [Candidatus Koribacter versatilis]ABF43546.1 transcriptional regulator, DeoR family [Candidatus Koribacter versatilis Ellin345]
MRADRLLSMLLLLQAHGRMTGRDLAERLEVSERTVHRDMESLSASGVPVYAVRGAQGGWQLEENWRTQVPGLDEAELRGLMMAQPRVVGDAKLASAAQRALEKLMAALPASLREQAASIRERLYVDTGGWRPHLENLAMLPLVQDAVARDRKLTMVYCKPNGERSERTVDPLGVVAKGSAWYLVANTSAGLRTFRVSRIEQATPLVKASKRPRDFNLARYWSETAKRLAESWRTYPVTLRLDARTARWMRTWSAAREVRSTDDDDWTTMELEFNHEEEAAFVVLGLGASVKVIEPAALRERVRRAATAILAMES